VFAWVFCVLSRSLAPVLATFDNAFSLDFSYFENARWGYGVCKTSDGDLS
jgi:hypothetical protein